jgi:hypothetical protein
MYLSGPAQALLLHDLYDLKLYSPTKSKVGLEWYQSPALSGLVIFFFFFNR